MKKRLTVYLIGYALPGWIPDKARMERLIGESDFCVSSECAVEVGQVLVVGSTLYDPHNGKKKPPIEDSRVVVVELREQGKVAVVEVLSEPN